MLYIVSGASRSGKTIIAKEVSSQMRIPYMSLDWIMMGFTNGIPEYGIRDTLFPDEIARRLWPFLKAMLESMIYVEADCIIEGEAVLPELIIELFKQYPGQLTICFLGYKHVDVERKLQDIRRFSQGETDWLHDKSDAYVVDHVKNMMTHSQMIETGCQEHKLTYFDTSENFRQGMTDAVDYLMAKS